MTSNTMTSKTDIEHERPKIERPFSIDWWTVTVQFINGQPLEFNFVGEYGAKEMYQKIVGARAKDEDVEIRDNFESTFTISTKNLSGVGIGHPEKILEKEVVKNMMIEQSKAKLRNRMQSDPTLKFLTATPTPGLVG